MTVQFSIIFKCLDWSLYELYDSTYFKSHDFDWFLVIDLCRLYALKKWFLRILSQIYHISIVQNTKNIACNGDNILKEYSQKPLTLAREPTIFHIFLIHHIKCMKRHESHKIVDLLFPDQFPHTTVSFRQQKLFPVFFSNDTRWHQYAEIIDDQM